MTVGKSLQPAGHLITVIAVLGFVVRAFVPIGYMPGSLSDGPLLIPCPAQHPGLGQLLAGLSGAEGHAHAHETAASTATSECSFAAAASPAAVPAAPLSAVTRNGPPRLTRDSSARFTDSTDWLYRPRGPPAPAATLI